MGQLKLLQGKRGGLRCSKEGLVTGKNLYGAMSASLGYVRKGQAQLLLSPLHSKRGGSGNHSLLDWDKSSWKTENWSLWPHPNVPQDFDTSYATHLFMLLGVVSQKQESKMGK